jgi:hypothetical protein
MGLGDGTLRPLGLTVPSTVGGMNALGDGSDGAVTLDGSTAFNGFSSLAGSTYTMTRDLHATSLTVNSGVTLKPSGYIIFVTGAVLLNGTLSFDGAAAAVGVAGAAVQKTVGSLPGGTGSTGNGATGATSTGILGGSALIAGAGASGTAGAANAIVGSLTATQIATRLKSPVGLLCGTVALAGSARQLCGGSSGSSGGGDGTNVGGGGGAGGGLIAVTCTAMTIGAAGVVSAVGGAGGTPSAGNCGSGSGGGGGGFLLYSRTALVNSGTITLTGGAPGAKTGTGTNGGTGNNGVSLNVVLG